MLAQAGIALAGVVLFTLASQLGRRYLASRTTWRGIRFVLDAQALRYTAVQMGWLLLTIMTIGLALPWWIASRAHWTIGRLRLGNLRFGFDGSGRALVIPTLVSIALNVIFGFGLAILAVALVSERAFHGDFLGVVLLAILPLVIIFGPGWLWLSAAEMRWRAEHTTLAGVRFAMPLATAWEVFRLLFGNWLIMLGTLTLLAPLTQARTFAFLARHMRSSDVPDLSGAEQQAAGPRTGEGLASLLGADVLAG